MKKTMDVITSLRVLSGNAQLDYLKQYQSELLRDILEYTYNPHKKYKVDEGKLSKFYQHIYGEREFTSGDWNIFKYTILDHLSNIASAKDEDVKDLCDYLSNFNKEAQEFMLMVLAKDLRINMGVKKFQKIWNNFCEEPQVQLAQKWEAQKFKNGFYSRKLDGIRNYYLQGQCWSRSNRLQKSEPVRHIVEQLQTLDCDNYVFDGELIYLNPDGTEDFQKAVSLLRSDERDVLCDNIYFVIFDAIPTHNFLDKSPVMETFNEEYSKLQELLCPTESGLSWSKTKLPNVLLIKQVKEDEADVLREAVIKYNWEGLMYRNGDAPYEFKRSKHLLKIKEMQDIELEVIGYEEGTGKHEGKLGAFVVSYEGFPVKVGSGYSDELREHYWQHKDECIGRFIKVQYFEKTINVEGKPSLRFPIFLCFRNPQTSEEYTLLY